MRSFFRSKANSTKAVVGNTKKKRNKIKLAYLSLVALLLLSSAAYLGYGYLQTRTFKAQAAAWTLIRSPGRRPPIAVAGCKTWFYNAWFGGLYSVKFRVTRFSGAVTGHRETVLRNGAALAGHDHISHGWIAWWSGSELLTSADLKDKINIQYKTSGGWILYRLYLDPANLTNC